EDVFDLVHQDNDVNLVDSNWNSTIAEVNDERNLPPETIVNNSETVDTISSTIGPQRQRRPLQLLIE
ncbi:hypothetical protein GcM3_005041, partial [Golovinomyces cichoracearum]